MYPLRLPRSGLLSLALLAGLAACDPPAPRFTQVEAPADARDVIGPYRVTAIARGADQVQARFTVVTGDTESLPVFVPLTRRTEARFEGDLPGQAPGGLVRVVLIARGPGGRATWPGENPHEFRIFEPSGACLVDGDCLPQEICDRDTRQCRVPPDVCARDADCPQDRTCEAGACRFRPSTCEEDADCGPGRVCEAGLCVGRPECVEDADCPGGRCVPPGRCVFEEPCPGGCPDGFQCIDNECVDPGACGGCPDGQRCHPELDACVECYADGHCAADRHCSLAPDFSCAEGPRAAPCTPCGPGGACGFDQICAEDTGFLCLTTCRDPGDCSQGTFCDGRVCRSDFICGGLDCRRDDDCEGACLAGTCTPRQACVADTDCAEGWSCRTGRCVPRDPPCFGASECQPGRICVGGRCREGEPAGVCAPCNGPDQCGSPALCIDTDGRGPRCVALCGRGGCPDGLSCFDAPPFGVCLTADATCTSPACGQDVLEPSNSPEAPVEVPIGGTELVVCQEDRDFLWLPALPGGRVVFTARTGRVDVLRTFADGTVIDRRTYPPDSGFEADLGEVPQRLEITTGEAFDVRYSIAVFAEVQPACDDDALEENDTPDDATILGSGANVNPTLCGRDPDWFRLRMRDGQPGGIVRITTQGRLDYALVAAGVQIGGGAVEGGSVDQPVRVLDEQFLVVTCSDCDGLRYNITTDFEGADCAQDVFEPNNSPEAARPVGVPTDRALNICAEDEDWYRIEVLGGLEARLILEFEHDTGDIELEVFNLDLESIGASTTGTDREEVGLPVRRRNVAYLARVYLFPGRGDRNTYRLRLTAR